MRTSVRGWEPRSFATSDRACTLVTSPQPNRHRSTQSQKTTHVNTRDQRFSAASMGMSIALKGVLVLKTRPSDTSQLEDRPEVVQTIPYPPMLFSAPAEAFTNLSDIAAKNLASAWRLWAELLEKQVGFASQFFDAFPLNAHNSTSASVDPVAIGASGSRASNLPHDNNPQAALPSSPLPTPAKVAVVKELPIKRYDDLSVPTIVSKLGRLRDADQIRHVLRHEAQNKRRKGVATAGKLQLERLAHEN